MCWVGTGLQRSEPFWLQVLQHPAPGSGRWWIRSSTGGFPSARGGASAGWALGRKQAAAARTEDVSHMPWAEVHAATGRRPLSLGFQGSRAARGPPACRACRAAASASATCW